MAHKFNPKNKDKLHSEERRKNLPSKLILQKIELQPGHQFIDIGCGIGYFSIPASEVVSPRGKVYALDTSEEMTAFLTAEVKALGRENIEIIQSSEYGFPLEEATGDRLLMSMVLHEVEDKKRFLKEAHRTLKASGEIMIIEWHKKETKQGPPLDHRIDSQETMNYLLEAGFINPELIEIPQVANTFYVITAKAKGSEA